MFTGSRKKWKSEEERLVIGGRADDSRSQISAKAEELWLRLSSDIRSEVSRSRSLAIRREIAEAVS